MGKYKSAIKALSDTYNYFGSSFLLKLREDIYKDNLRGNDTYVLSTPIDNGMDQLIYSWLVMMYGDYGTSPRYGWITDMKGAVKWLDEFMDYWKDNECGGDQNGN